MTPAQALRSNGLRTKIPSAPRSFYNCWGFTAFNQGWLPEAKWLNYVQTERLLATRTTPIPAAQIQPGDVAVFRCRHGELHHTAIVANPAARLLVHKPGSCELTTDTLDEALDIYPGTLVTYARPVGDYSPAQPELALFAGE